MLKLLLLFVTHWNFNSPFAPPSANEEMAKNSDLTSKNKQCSKREKEGQTVPATYGTYTS